MTAVHEALVLCPSCVSENVGKNKKGENQNYARRRNNGSENRQG